MAKIENILELALTTGGTVNIPVQTNLSAGSFNGSVARVTGSETLTSGFTISPTGTPVKNTQVKILWEAATTLGGNTVTIFGSAVPNSFFDNGGPDAKFIATCTYSGSAWSVSFAPSADASFYVAEGNIAVGAVTESKLGARSTTLAKMAELPTGNIIYGNASNAPTALDLSTDGMLMIGDATNGVAAFVMSGDGTLSKAGVFAIGAGKVLEAMLADGAVTASKLSANANKYTRDIAISFETSAQVGVLNFIICENCTIEKVSGTVMSHFADDTGTVIFKDNSGTVMTGSQIDFTTSLVLGNQVTNTVTANNTFTAGQKITLELSKTTKTSGKAIISLCIVKS